MSKSNAKEKAHKRFKSNRKASKPTKRTTPSPWPRRLLHVSSMTSLERRAGSIYGEHKEPSYHAISYTWARFADSRTEAVQVSNISWTVPSVKDAHFSNKEFEAAIQLAGRGVDFVWVDIACIDQEDPVVKMEEIGKQVAIFERASKVFAWLAPWTIQDLERSFQDIEAFCRTFYEPMHGGLTSYMIKSASKRPGSTVVVLLAAIQDLTAQPWFTSSWTLQEAFLRKDAILMSRSSAIPLMGAVMDEDLEIPVTLNWLLVRCQQVFTASMSMEHPSATEACQHLVDSGLLSLSSKNEWTLYTASTKRQASLQDDRIYGIMQIYNISLGRQSSFSILQDAFAFLLNSQNPVLAQLHMHHEPPATGKSWGVSEHMEIPFVFMHILTSRPECKIYSSPRRIPLFSGRFCRFIDLLNVWRSVIEHREADGRSPYLAHVLLDAQNSQNCKALDISLSPSRQNQGSFSSQWASEVNFEDLTNHLPLSTEQYSVLLLGYTTIGEDWPISYAVGLLVFQRLEATGKPWTRAGSCAWRYEPGLDPTKISVVSPESILEDEFPAPEGLWRSINGRLG